MSSESSFDELLNLVEMNHQLACDPESGGCGNLNYIHHFLSRPPHVFMTGSSIFTSGMLNCFFFFLGIPSWPFILHTLGICSFRLAKYMWECWWYNSNSGSPEHWDRHQCPLSWFRSKKHSYLDFCGMYLSFWSKFSGLYEWLYLWDVYI